MNAVISALMGVLTLQNGKLLAQTILVAVFLVAGMAKLRQRDKTRTMMGEFGVPLRLIDSATLLLPLGEFAVAAGLIVPAFAAPAATGAALLLALFTAAVGVKLAQGQAPDCNCFGQTKSKPIGPLTLLRNGLLLALAIGLVWLGPAFTASTSWGTVPTMLAWAVLTASFATAFGLMAAIAVVRVRRWRRRRRRLLERNTLLGSLRNAPPVTLKPASTGLPTGSPAPDFRLSDGKDGFFGLDDMIEDGRPILLTFIGAGCPSCDMLPEESTRWRSAGGVTPRIVLVHEGPARGQALPQRGLVQQDREVADDYRCWGSPEAVLVRQDRKIGSGVIKGMVNIRAFVTAYIHLPPPISPLSPEQPTVEAPERLEHPRVAATRKRPAPTVRVGDRAPALSFRDQHGKNHAFEDFLGRELLLLFWSPYCSYCQNMLDTLAIWVRDPPPWAPALLVVTPSDKDNDQVLRLGASVTVDADRKLSTAFGINGTPTGILLDREGRIAADHAMGADDVMAMANGVLTAAKAAQAWAQLPSAETLAS